MTSCLILQAGGKQRHPPHSTHLTCRWDVILVCLSVNSANSVKDPSAGGIGIWSVIVCYYY